MLVRIAEGGDIHGRELLALPGYELALPIEPHESWPGYEVIDLVYRAAQLVAKTTGQSLEDLTSLALGFRKAAEASALAGVTINPDARLFAWELGMAADFAAGLDGAGLLPSAGKRDEGGVT
jgi:hypothetical protein